ncbi:MAG: hypothetical protein H6835_05130 [Planctomycetes bacterium]|nr:hypothetical protein [Planctomycetota bacterium]
MRGFEVVMLAVALAGCAAPGAPTTGTVRALRFYQFLSDGAMDLVHGGGRWHDCLFLPDAGVVCWINFGSELAPAGDGLALLDTATLFAHHSTLEHELALRPPGSKHGDEAPEPVALDARLAARIVALADLQRQHQQAAAALAADGIAAGVFGNEASLGARDF